MMHYEAGVRTVVAGGRPQLGPMQARAGTRGARSYDAGYLDSDIYSAETLNTSSTTKLPDRNLDFRLDRAHFNLEDQIRRGENFPLQFAYEAANCRIFYTPKTFFDFAALWQYAADAVWTNSALCVKDSTNHPSAGHVTDTVGPSSAQKAAWAATGSGNVPSTPNDQKPIDLSLLITANGPDDDAAGNQGKACDPNSPGVLDFCGPTSDCVQAPYCGSGGNFDPNSFRCRRTCGYCLAPETCGSKFANCEYGEICDFCTTKFDISSRNCATKTSATDGSGVPNYKQNNPGDLALGANTEGPGTGGSGAVAKYIMAGIGG